MSIRTLTKILKKPVRNAQNLRNSSKKRTMLCRQGGGKRTQNARKGRAGVLITGAISLWQEAAAVANEPDLFAHVCL